ncbi:MAG: hypothetical protein ABIO70_16685 [Pseudomonadota bacterium]
MTRLALLLLATLGCTPGGDSGPIPPGDSEADADTDTDTDTDTEPEPQETWETVGDCPDLEEVRALPEAGGEVLFEGDPGSGSSQWQGGFTAVFQDEAAWAAFLEEAALGHLFPNQLDWDGAQVLVGVASDGATCGSEDLEVHDVVLGDGTHHLDVTQHGDAGDDCDMVLAGGAFHRVPAGPASVCARQHEEER